MVADFLENPDAGTLVDRRASHAGQPIEAKAIDAANCAVARRGNIRFHRAEIGPARRRSLSVDDLLHLLERFAAFKKFACARITGSAPQIRIVLQYMGRQPQRLLPEIRWRIGFVGKHRHDVLGLKNGPDTPADRLAAVGSDHLDRDAEVVADEFKELP